MRRNTIASQVMLAAVAAAVLLPVKEACSAQRAFVASIGTDNPACSLTAPCRTFTAAVTAVNTGGEVIVLDTGGYGAITIGKSVSITVPSGIYAGITVSSGDGITVNGSGIIVAFRGLTINGQGGNNGIAIADAATTRVENCVISNLNASGIYHTAGMLYVEDTTVRNNAGIGIWSIGAVQANLDRVRMEENLDGVRAQHGAYVAVHDSVMTHNAQVGAFAFADSGGAEFVHTKLTVSRSLISFNQEGAQARGIGVSAADLAITDSTISDNVNNGLLTTQSTGGFATMWAVRNTVLSKFMGGSNSVWVSPSTHFLADANFTDNFFLNSGSFLFTFDNNAGSPSVSVGAVVQHRPLF
jgi:hypothetical protein